MFLFPLYLLGAAALGVPLWVHLRNRQSSPPYRFATLRFLIESSIVSERRKQILRWLVLLLRVAALAALALAFAQPWLAAAILPGSAAAVLVIDTSASMKTAGAWQLAKNAAFTWLDEQPTGTRVCIVTLGRSARPLTTFADPIDQQRAAIDALSPSFETTDPDPAIRLGGRLLEQQAVSDKHLTVITDLTTAGWRNVDWDKPLPPAVTLTVRPILPETPANTAVTDLRGPRSFWNTTAPLEIVATVRNFSSFPRSCTVIGTSDAKEATRQLVSLPAGGSQDVMFSLTPKQLVTFRGSVYLEGDDAFAADNKRYFAIPARKPLRVAHWAAKPDEADVFLQTALEPAADTSANRYKWTPANLTSTEPLAKSIDVLLVDQGAPLDATRAGLLQQFLSDGGRVIVFLGDSDKLTIAEQSWLPITLGQKRTADTSPAHPATLNFRHPILDPFSRPHGGDLFRVGVTQWRSFTCPAATPLISLAGGDPLLSVLSAGKGRVAIFALPMRRAWSDWPIQSTFLPLMHETLKWLEGDATAEAGLLVGDVGPDGKPTREPGYAGAEESPGGVMAVNLDPRESDLKRWTMLDRFKQLENPDRTPPSAAPAAMMMTDDSGKKLTWMLLIGVAIFSLCELLLANRTPR